MKLFYDSVTKIKTRGITAAASLLVALSLVAIPGNDPVAVEQFVTTSNLVRTAPHIAHVRVLGSHSVPGVAALEYELTVLEVLKGSLPGQLRMRMLSGFRIVNPGGVKHPAGSEWIVFLGSGQAGLYPIRSLQWGRIDVGTHASSGEQFLIKKLTGFPRPAQGNYHSLQEFRTLVSDILSDATKKVTGK